jgi:hypothetical protein
MCDNEEISYLRLHRLDQTFILFTRIIYPAQQLYNTQIQVMTVVYLRQSLD